MIGRLLLTTLLLLGAATPPAAAGALDCAHALTTADMLDCADRDLQVADKQLNQAYGELKQAGDTENTRLLLDAQRAWLRFRDASCLYAADEMRGGSMAGVIEAGCLTDMTKVRARELSAMAKQKR